MARPALDLRQKQNILQAKQLLRTLWRQSGLRQQDLLTGLEDRGLGIRKNTLSNWLSETDLKRPDPECLLPLIELLCPQQPDFSRLMHEEIERLLGYEVLPSSPDAVLNRIARQIQGPPAESGEDDNPLLTRLYELEERIFIYDRTYPVLRFEPEAREQVKAALGPDRAHYRQYKVSRGYELPLSRLRSLPLLTEIIESLHECVRVLRAYVEKNLLLSGPLQRDYPLFEELLAYIWEISNRLLQNESCRQSASMHASLLSILGACQGLRYLLESQHGTPSLIAFQNVLQMKGMSSQAEIHCTMAVYVGMVARQLLSGSENNQLHNQITASERLRRGLRHFEQALELLSKSYPELSDERARFFYQKETANLCYDVATLLLWRPDLRERSLTLMNRAHRHYAAVLKTDNLFKASLSPQRLAYLEVFYTISAAWCCQEPESLLVSLTMQDRLAQSKAPDENHWLGLLACAMSCGILYFRFHAESGPDLTPALGLASRALERARLVPGMESMLDQELRQDYVLSQLLPRLDVLLRQLGLSSVAV